MPETVDIVIVADGVGGEQSGGDLKGDVAVNISINENKLQIKT